MPTFVSAQEIEASCSLKAAIETQRKVFVAHSRGETVLGPRAVLAQGENAQFSYIARASKSGPTIVKFGTVFPGNSGRNMPAVQTTVAVMSEVDGSLTHFFNGEAITQLRTVATSMAVALELSAKPKKVAIVGLGHQGLAHALAVKELFAPIELIGVSRIPFEDNSDIFTNCVTDLGLIQDCDLIILCTNSQTPVLKNQIKPGALCISIGSFAPNRSEVLPELLIGKQSIYVDDPEISSQQCGSVASALTEREKNGLSLTSIGSLFSGASIKDLQHQNYFFSVGLGIQDAALVEFLLEKVA